jgi:hypothetical protein
VGRGKHGLYDWAIEAQLTVSGFEPVGGGICYDGESCLNTPVALVPVSPGSRQFYAYEHGNQPWGPLCESLYNGPGWGIYMYGTKGPYYGSIQPLFPVEVKQSTWGAIKSLYKD